jgi:hypothetical protein
VTPSNNIAAILLAITGNIRISARRCRPLALRLQQCAPADLSTAQRERLEVVSARAGEVDDVLTQRERGSGAVVREPRQRAGMAFTLLHQRLTATAALPESLGGEGPEAQRLVASYFPEGVSFTQLPAVEAWQHGSRLTARMSDEGARERIEVLAGPLFLRNVEQALDVLGEAVGVRGVAISLPSPRALADAVARFSFAVGAYGRALSIDIVEDDEATIERVVSATSPISEMRSRSNGEEGGDLDTDDTDDTDTDDTDTDADPSDDTDAPDPSGPSGPFVS